MRGRSAVGLVARREIVERVREKSFLISTALNLVIIVGVVIVAAVAGGDGERYVVGYADEADAPVLEAAAAGGAAIDVQVEARRVPAAEVRPALEDGSLDAALLGDRIVSEEEPPVELVSLLQGASAQAEARTDPTPLEVTTLQPVDPDEDAKAAVAFFTILILYGQLLTYGYWVAAGVVEEKASRVVEVVLSTIRPAHLLAGKVIGLGLLGLASLLLTAGVGLAVAQATGTLDVDAGLLGSAALALVWFVVGYAFYACAFACAGALVPRQEELQSSMTPLTLTILVAFFVAFAVNDDPDGTLAHVTAFIPMTAPVTMPPRIVAGEVPAWEVVASFAVTLGCAALLIPLAARIYEGGILRTGSALKLREAWRAGRT